MRWLCSRALVNWCERWFDPHRKRVVSLWLFCGVCATGVSLDAQLCARSVDVFGKGKPVAMNELWDDLEDEAAFRLGMCAK